MHALLVLSDSSELPAETATRSRNNIGIPNDAFTNGETGAVDLEAKGGFVGEIVRTAMEQGPVSLQANNGSSRRSLQNEEEGLRRLGRRMLAAAIEGSLATRGEESV